MSAIARILVPIDIHQVRDTKVAVATTYAQAFGAEIILLHVHPAEHTSTEAVSPAEVHAHTYLDAVTSRLHAEGLSARSFVRAGRPAETILAEIVAQQADLVVLGSNVRHGLSRLLLGSVAEEVVARASCPVLLVRPRADSFASLPAVRNFAEDAARAGPLAQRDLGMRTVEVARIIGSVGRALELDEHFQVRR